MRGAFTLIEMLVVIALIGLMAGYGAVSIASGRGAARVKGATRDIYAAIRRARSTALVTGQRVLVNYSNEKIDDEIAVKIDIVAAKIMNADADRPKPQPYYVMEYKELKKGNALSAQGSEAKTLGAEGSFSEKSSSDEGETIEEILFSPMSADVIKGMRILVKKGDEVLTDETAEQTRSRISVFSNVDYLQSRYKAAVVAEAAKNEAKDETLSSADKDLDSPSGGVDDMTEPVSVVWQTNGAVEPHKVWIYPDGNKPEDGLMLSIDSFGAVKVLGGDGRGDED